MRAIIALACKDLGRFHELVCIECFQQVNGEPYANSSVIIQSILVSVSSVGL